MSLQIQAFQASPSVAASPMASSNRPLLPYSNAETLSSARKPRNHFKTRFRAVSFPVRRAIILLLAFSVGILYWRWTLGLWVHRSPDPPGLDARERPPVDPEMPPIADAHFPDPDRNSALDLELKSLPAEFHRVTGSYPTPLFAMPCLSPPQTERYAHLRRIPVEHPSVASGKIMLVASLKNVEELLFDLVHAIYVVTSFLGPGQASISLLEGPSTDHTARILDEILYPALIRLGVAASDIHLQLDMSKVDWWGRNRIELLAELRNAALEPVWEDNGVNIGGKASTAAAGGVKYNEPRTVGKDVDTVVFFNDVYLSAAHILELLHQHVRAGQDTAQEPAMTNGMDFRKGNDGEETFFYDVWVARTVSGSGALADSRLRTGTSSETFLMRGMAITYSAALIIWWKSTTSSSPSPCSALGMALR